MAPYGVSVDYTIPFRGNTERVSFVFHYEASVTAFDFDALADGVSDACKPVLTTSQNIVGARVWGPTNQGQVASITRSIRDYSKAGTMVATGGSFYPELAFYVSMYLGRSPTTNRKRFLRKWIHTGRMPSSTGTIVGDSLISTSEKNIFKNWFEGMKSITVLGQAWDICAPNGDHLPIGTTAVVGDRLHIRQLKQ